MSAPSPDPDPQAHRELLARLDRDQERIRDENEWMRPDPQAERVARHAEREARESLGDAFPWNAVRVLLPANADPLAPVEATRRELFAAHLADLAARVSAEPDCSPVPEAPEDGPAALIAAACTACRGSCCRSGGDHAYLTEETLARAWRARPDRPLAEVVDAYTRLLPAESVRDSCIYHAATGCALPRALRSDTCNRHLCGKLKQLLTTLPAERPPPLLAVLFDDGRWARTALIDASGARILAEEAPDSGPA